MDKEYLENLGIAPEVAEVIAEEHEKVVTAHQKQLQELKLAHMVETAVRAYGGRNLKAVTALLDMTAIEKSEDASAALDTALKALKKENSWLFESAAPPQYAPFTGADTAQGAKPVTLASALRERMRK